MLELDKISGQTERFVWPATEPDAPAELQQPGAPRPHSAQGQPTRARRQIARSSPEEQALAWQAFSNGAARRAKGVSQPDPKSSPGVTIAELQKRFADWYASATEEEKKLLAVQADPEILFNGRAATDRLNATHKPVGLSMEYVQLVLFGNDLYRASHHESSKQRGYPTGWQTEQPFLRWDGAKLCLERGPGQAQKKILASLGKQLHLYRGTSFAELALVKAAKAFSDNTFAQHKAEIQTTLDDLVAGKGLTVQPDTLAKVKTLADDLRTGTLSDGVAAAKLLASALANYTPKAAFNWTTPDQAGAKGFTIEAVIEYVVDPRWISEHLFDQVYVGMESVFHTGNGGAYIELGWAGPDAKTYLVSHATACQVYRDDTGWKPATLDP